jgi:predicted O-linked N-acetylglucosamine transferase (SPINDLY family)
MHLLGLIHLQRGDIPRALDALDRALRITPRNAHAHNHRAAALLALGRAEEAVASSEQALRLDPTLAAAHTNRGNALAALGRFADAIASFEEALRLAPGAVGALNNLGLALLSAGRPAEALERFEHALRHRPDEPALLTRLAAALTDLGRYDDARAALRRALAIAPSLADAHNQLGYLHQRLGQHEDALASFQQVLRLEPRNVAALLNRAHVLLELRRAAESLASAETALATAPRFADAHNARGNALMELHRSSEACESFTRAVELNPGFAEAYSNLGDALTQANRAAEAADCYARLVALAPDHDYALGHRLLAQLRICDWHGLAETRTEIERKVAAGRRVSDPFSFLAASDRPGPQLDCARIFVADRYPPAPPVRRRSQGDALGKRLHIAYLSADFHDHATAYLAARLFELHDRQRFELSAVSFGPERSGAMRDRLRGAFHHWHDVRAASDREVAERLAERGIDIAVDLKGFTSGCRTGILAHRPAPIQVAYLGYPGTMGAPYIDYVLADREVIPPEHRRHYSEQVVYLSGSGSYQINDDEREIAPVTPGRAEFGLRDDEFVFCSFNGSFKLVPEVFDVWMRLLGAVERSVLWLLVSDPTTRRNLRSEAARRGIDERRLVFAERRALAQHLARYRAADLFLDTLPVNAHTTASDALWAGLPVLTCRGATFAGRVAASVVRSAGLPELITDDLGAYERLALRLATVPDELAALRARLAARRDSCELFDSDRTRRSIEAAFVAMWERYVRGEPPAAFEIPS